MWDNWGHTGDIGDKTIDVINEDILYKLKLIEYGKLQNISSRLLKNYVRN